MHYSVLARYIFVSFIFTSPASANCILFNDNERLSNYCLLESVTGKLLDKNSTLFIAKNLRREGYFGGLEKPEFSTRFYPTIDYSNNINGGNPDKPFILGALEFEGDKDLIKQEGIITALNAEVRSRLTFDVGKYIDTSLLGSYSYSPKHKNGFSTVSIDTCLKNKIAPRNSLDFCTYVTKQKKEISENSTKNFSLNLGHLSFNKNAGFTEGKIGVTHLVSNNYSQNQIALSLDTIHKKSFYTSIVLRLGEPVQNSIALNYGLNLKVASILNNRKLGLEFSHELNNGGLIFGVKRSEITNRVSLNSILNNNANLRFSYTSVDSSIDYFDQSYPSLVLTYLW